MSFPTSEKHELIKMHKDKTKRDSVHVASVTFH